MRPLLLLTAALSLLTLGMARKDNFSLTFHGQGTASEAPTFAFPATLMGSGRPIFLQRMPLISNREIKAFYPFAAADGSNGAYFQLDSHGAALLAQFSMSRQGTFLVALLNGRQIVDLRVNEPVTDGILTIPSGLTSEDISLLGTRFPTMGAVKKGRRE